MTFFWRTFILLLLAFSSICVYTPKALGQWIEPAVSVEGAEEGILSPAEAETLSRRMTELVRSYDPHVELKPPLHPVDLRIVLDVVDSRGGVPVADMLVRAFRPVYGSDSDTSIFQALDKGIEVDKEMNGTLSWELSTLPNVPFLHKLYYYLTISLALYYDSLGMEGGELLWKKLEDATLQISGAEMRSQESSYSYPAGDIIPLIRTPRMGLFREIWAEYHRLVLDQLTTSPMDIPDRLTAIVRKLLTIRSDSPDFPMVRLFADTKSKEILKLYESFADAQKRQYYPILSQLVPTLTRP